MNANIAALSAQIRQAVQEGAEFIALPENALLMEAPGAPSPLAYASHAEHPGIKACQKLAREYGSWILVGSVAVADPASGKKFNRGVLIDGKGELLPHYDKIHLFDADLGEGERYSESARFAAGSRAVLADTPWGRLGLTICYDLRFPQLYRSLAKAGAVMLAAPAAFTARTGEAHWHVLLRARAIETGCFLIAPAQCGLHPGNRRTFGHSLIIGPWGEILAEAGDAPGIIHATLDLHATKEARRRLPCLQHDRDFSEP